MSPAPIPIVALLMVLGCLFRANAQPSGQVPPPVSGDAIATLETAIPGLKERLSTLEPSDPEAYFLLAEEVADAAAEGAELALARRLFLIAFDGWREQGASAQAASACIGLTLVVSTERDKRWLQAVARTLEPRYATPMWEPPGSISIEPGVAYQAATALGAVRSGDGLIARQFLAMPSVTLVLDRYGSLLQPAGGLTRVRRDANVWPCPECKNKRVSRSRVPGESIERICASCRGDPGPRMTDAEVIAHLRLESLLLAGTHESWAAQVAVDDAAPLRDPDPDAVAKALGIDTSLTLFRDGVWVAPPANDSAPSDAGSP